MKRKNIVINKSVIVIILAISILTVFLTTIVVNQNNKIVGKIYFNKLVSGERAYAYLCDESGKELFGKWPGIELANEEDYIYYFEVIGKIDDKIDNCKVTFNDGEKYTIEECEGYNKIYNLTSGIEEKNIQTSGNG